MTGLAVLDSRGPAKTTADELGTDPLPRSRYEKALTLSVMGFYEEAIDVLRDVTVRTPDHAPAWRKLAELLRFAERDDEAADAEAKAAGKGALWPAARDLRSSSEIDEAESSLHEAMGALADPAEQREVLRGRLRSDATDAAAMHLLGRLESSRNNLIVARTLFERALSLAPDYEGVLVDFSQLLRKIGEHARAVAVTSRLTSGTSSNAVYRALHADGLRAIGDLEGALPIIEKIVREQPKHARFRAGYAQALHFAGRREESVKEFRTCLDIQPGMGEAYWGLAELRGNYLTEKDIADIRSHLPDGKQDKPHSMLLYYALGHALEKQGKFEDSFAAYKTGAAVARELAAERGEAYDRIEEAGKLQQYRAVYTGDLFGRHARSPAAEGVTPIFIVGMPRAGSTLVEQILASHSLVEATLELPLIGAITRDLTFSRRVKTPNAYPGCARSLTAPQLAELGARYLEEIKPYRKTNLPYVVDKRPWNWLEIGLIQLILPHAKIIDVRREPMAACFGMFKQMLANEPASYAFNDLAAYYTQYVSMMRYWDEVLPGRVHFLKYERLVEDTETEIRRLLEYCGLPFEESCLRFWETNRAVATPSAEQVRRPIYRDALQQWRKFEPWLGPLKEALQTAEAEAAAVPHPVEYERALSFAAMGLYSAALEELRDFVTRENHHHGAWKKLAELLRFAGEDKAAADADAAASQCASHASKWRSNLDPRSPAQLQIAEQDLLARFCKLGRTEQMEALREHVDHNPTDAAATYLLSRLEMEDGDNRTAIDLLYRTLELSPLHHTARANLAVLLMQDSLGADALEQSTILVQQVPENLDYRVLHSDILRGMDDFLPAEKIMEEAVREQPQHAHFWFSYGRLLHVLGKRDESASALRKCLELAPSMGEAYWGLADLKSGFLTDADVAAIRTQLTDPALRSTSRMHMYYALGRALEDRGDFAGSFAAYQQGARLFRGFFLTRGQSYNEDIFADKLRSIKNVYTSRLLTKHTAHPDRSDQGTPIFIVGMPRAGSTLVEQILASHSQIEGTRELPLIGDIVQDLNLSRRIKTRTAYPECVRKLNGSDLSKLGARYLERAKVYRKTDRPYFIDKRPWNWLEVGLIHLILPHAKIIDIRREPMAACFAMFKQIMIDGADYSYDLRNLGGYYRGYVGLMEHWKSVLPGRVHFLQYEHLVEDTEAEIRGLLEYCGLPFEESCLRFWETDRAVFTPSAEQVRRPIFRDALEQWRKFEPWLGPLKAGLAQPLAF